MYNHHIIFSSSQHRLPYPCSSTFKSTAFSNFNTNLCKPNLLVFHKAFKNSSLKTYSYVLFKQKKRELITSNWVTGPQFLCLIVIVLFWNIIFLTYFFPSSSLFFVIHHFSYSRRDNIIVEVRKVHLNNRWIVISLIFTCATINYR